ncbi:MAG TPA: dTMP kinase [Clostridiales bacterium]|nr:dTMP kinase [Clostridiales bacterium]
MVKGIFISFEGLDGSGKSTQISRVRSFLESCGRRVVMVREPGGTVISEKIREIILDVGNRGMAPAAEALLYAASRAQLTAEVIRPSLDAGMDVVCDRYVDSSLAYQGWGRQLGFEQVLEINRLSVNGTFPDITFLLDIPPEEAMRRTSGKGRADRIEEEAPEFHRRVYEGFNRLAALYAGRYRVIDGTGLPGEVSRQIQQILKKELIKRRGGV